MKTVENLLADLSYGELSDLSISNDGDGTITDAAKPKILVHINDVLSYLYSRYELRTKDCVIEMVEGVTNYHLDSRFALSKYDEDSGYDPYILDTVGDPFIDDVIKILFVVTQDGRSLPINDSTRSDSVYTPQAKVLQIPFPMAGDVLSVAYQSTHDPITIDNLDQEFELPMILYQPLRQLVASRVFNAMDGKEAKAMNLVQLAEQQLLVLEQSDAMGVTISQSNQRFELGGWA